MINKPEFPVFQYFRGVLWILCLTPLFKRFTGGRVELFLLSTLALGLLPTAALAFPNPLMPAEVSQNHFWEVLLSNALFGALCAWFVPKLNEFRLGASDEQSISQPEHITKMFENVVLGVDHQAH